MPVIADGNDVLYDGVFKNEQRHGISESERLKHQKLRSIANGDLIESQLTIDVQRLNRISALQRLLSEFFKALFEFGQIFAFDCSPAASSCPPYSTSRSPHFDSASMRLKPLTLLPLPRAISPENENRIAGV